MIMLAARPAKVIMARSNMEIAAVYRSNYLTQFFILAFLVLQLAHVSNAPAAQPSADDTQGSSIDSGELYWPSGDVMSEIEKATSTARLEGQLVLVIMGANWCHDSRALASRIYEEPLSTVIEQHYQVVFVDVAYLDRGRDVISSIGPPVYYATPTVLILDPVSGMLVNENNRHQWGGAASISMTDSVEYFQQMADADLSDLSMAETQSAELQALMKEIDAFEQTQADRLYEAYAVIGPLLRAYKAGEEPENFEAYWEEVRRFRMSVARNVETLRSVARELASAESGEIILDYPEYPAFSWKVQE
jgi:hypothetical protein